MSNDGTEDSKQNPQQDQPQNPGQDAQQNDRQPPEFDAALDQFARAESARRRKGIVLALIAAIVAVGVFFVAVVFRDDLFESGVDVEEIDTRIAARTNDPQCRNMIAEVGELSERFFKLEPTIDAELLGDDPEAINEIRDEVARLQLRVDQIAEASQEANLRFDESRQQLDDWFEYIALELTFVDRLARERLAEIAAMTDGAGDAGTAADAASPKEANAKADDGVVVKLGADAGSKSAAAGEDEGEDEAEQTPLERKRGALVALHDSFQKFRIWHTANAHPCGAADEGETPWKPAEGAPAAGDEAAGE
jgi:hypothetical protein